MMAVDSIAVIFLVTIYFVRALLVLLNHSAIRLTHFVFLHAKDTCKRNDKYFVCSENLASLLCRCSSGIEVD